MLRSRTESTPDGQFSEDSTNLHDTINSVLIMRPEYIEVTKSGDSTRVAFIQRAMQVIRKLPTLVGHYVRSSA